MLSTFAAGVDFVGVHFCRSLGLTFRGAGSVLARDSLAVPRSRVGHSSWVIPPPPPEISQSNFVGRGRKSHVKFGGEGEFMVAQIVGNASWVPHEAYSAPNLKVRKFTTCTLCSNFDWVESASRRFSARHVTYPIKKSAFKFYSVCRGGLVWYPSSFPVDLGYPQIHPPAPKFDM